MTAAAWPLSASSQLELRNCSPPALCLVFAASLCSLSRAVFSGDADLSQRQTFVWFP
jgi:hypothetical protein